MSTLRWLALAALVFCHFDFVALASSTSVRRVEFVQEFRPRVQALIELWIPTPLETAPYQRLIHREFQGNATVVRVSGDAAQPAPVVYVRWEKVKDPVLKIINVLEIQDRDGVSSDTTDYRRFLQATDHVQIDGIVKATADKITAGLRGPDQKAKAIFNWIVDNTFRDPSTRGCGLGDVKTLLLSGNPGGKCADLNSLFVGLARASGIPAREVFGQRVAPSAISKSLGKEDDNSKAQHCRAEYYSVARKGWVPVDPADVRKFILEENLSAKDAKVRKLRAKFFGFWEGTWIAYNYARDFRLEGYNDEKVNFFMYPLLADTKIRPDGVDPEQTGYSFTTSVQ
jgi:transglutaminase-like putative cysteine protease